MRYLLSPLLSLSLIALAGCGSKAAPENTGPWLLDSKESSISYVTIKNGSIGEANTFSMLSGEVSEGGKAEFIVYQELAGLQSITPVVSATVGLTFER